jgi:hypothetical protein
MRDVVLALEFFLGFGIFVYLIWPLIAGEGDHFPVLDDLSEERRKDKVLEALRDLEYEHETGKISTEDYRELRNHYLDRAVGLFDEDELDDASLETAESDRDVGDEIEEKIARKREQLQ